MRNRDTMCCAKAAKIMTLHRTGKTLTDSNARGIDFLTRNKMISQHNSTDLYQIFFCNTEFNKLFLWRHTSFGETLTLGLGNTFSLGLTCTQLNRGITVFFIRFLSHNLTAFERQHCDRNMIAKIIINLGHAQFLGEYA